MTTTIQIRNVPEATHAVLRGRAARAGMSLQEYLLSRIVAEAASPTKDEILARAGERTGGRLSLRDAEQAVRAERDSR